MRHHLLSCSLILTVCGLARFARAQTLINVRVAGGNPGTPTGIVAFGNSSGDFWNYFPNLSGRASGGGVVTNATTIKDSSGATLAGVTMNMPLSGGDGLDNYTDNNAFSPTPVLIMGNYIYESAGENYFTFTFSGLPANKAYFLYGLGNGNASGQGSTWWLPCEIYKVEGAPHRQADWDKHDPAYKQKLLDWLGKRLNQAE